MLLFSVRVWLWQKNYAPQSLIQPGFELMMSGSLKNNSCLRTLSQNNQGHSSPRGFACTNIVFQLLTLRDFSTLSYILLLICPSSTVTVGLHTTTDLTGVRTHGVCTITEQLMYLGPLSQINQGPSSPRGFACTNVLVQLLTLRDFSTFSYILLLIYASSTLRPLSQINWGPSNPRGSFSSTLVDPECS